MDEKLKADRCQPGSIRSLPGMRSAVRWLAPVRINPESSLGITSINPPASAPDDPR